MKPSSISINATNLAITELSENFSFNSACVIGDNVFVGTNDGIFVFDNDLSIDESRVSSFVTGSLDFGTTNPKRIRSVTVFAKAPGKLLVELYREGSKKPDYSTVLGVADFDDNNTNSISAATIQQTAMASTEDIAIVFSQSSNPDACTCISEDLRTQVTTFKSYIPRDVEASRAWSIGIKSLDGLPFIVSEIYADIIIREESLRAK